MTGKSIFATILAIVLLACKITTHRKFGVQLSVNSDSLQKKVQRLVNTDKVNLYGMEEKINGTDSSFELHIEIMNPVNLSTVQNSEDSVALAVATMIKSSIKDNDKFDGVTLSFVYKTIKNRTITTVSRIHSWKTREK